MAICLKGEKPERRTALRANCNKGELPYSRITRRANAIKAKRFAFVFILAIAEAQLRNERQACRLYTCDSKRQREVAATMGFGILSTEKRMQTPTADANSVIAEEKFPIGFMTIHGWYYSLNKNVENVEFRLSSSYSPLWPFSFVAIRLFSLSPF